MNKQAIKKIKRNGASLIICCDCGTITRIKRIYKYTWEKGIDDFWEMLDDVNTQPAPKGTIVTQWIIPTGIHLTHSLENLISFDIRMAS